MKTLLPDPIQQIGIAQFGIRLRRGEITSEAVTRQYLERIAALLSPSRFVSSFKMSFRFRGYFFARVPPLSMIIMAFVDIVSQSQFRISGI